MKLFTKMGLCVALLMTAACAHQSENSESRTVASAKKGPHPTRAIYAALSCSEANKKRGQAVQASVLLRPTSAKLTINSEVNSLKRNAKLEKRLPNGKVNPLEDKYFSSADYTVVAPGDIFRADGPVQITTKFANKKVSLMNCIALERLVERSTKKK